LNSVTLIASVGGLRVRYTGPPRSFQCPQ